MAATPSSAQLSAGSRFEVGRLPLFASAQEEFSGRSAQREFFIRLPEHVAFRPGSALNLVLRPSPQLMVHVCSVQVLLNDREIAATNLHSAPGAPNHSVLALRTPIPEQALTTGWNRLQLRFTLHSGESGAGPESDATWTLRQTETFLSLPFERLPLFPELSRFPATLTEEKLLRPDADSPFTDAIVPQLSILIPGRCRDAHLRATAIVAARLGQLGYITERHCRIEALEFWKNEVSQRNAVLIARRDQLGGIEIPDNITAAIGSLVAGQGLVAEFVHGTKGQPRRVVLISGADDLGLEKAALTLGSAPALADAPPNPAIIEQSPQVSTRIEGEAGAGPVSVKLNEVRLQGPFHDAQSVLIERLPPGFRAGAEGRLELHWSHSGGLVQERSSLEVFLNDVSLGVLPLTPGAENTGQAHLPIPEGLPGRDPIMLTFRTVLDPGPGACNQRASNETALIITTNSTLLLPAEPIPMIGLSQAQQFLLKDRFAQRAAYLLASTPTLEEVRGLFGLWFNLGRMLPSSPILWPEVVIFNGPSSATAKRLGGRSVLFLGPVWKWKTVLTESGQIPAILLEAPESKTVSIQGRSHPLADFESSLVFAQMVPSPWDEAETLLLAGGWKEAAPPALHRLLLDPAMPARLEGTLVAMDGSGRMVSHDLRKGGEPFAERIHRGIAPGLSPEESAAQVVRHDADKAQRRSWSVTFSWFCGSILTLLVAGRLWLMRDQARVRQKAFQAEKVRGRTQ